MARRAIPWLLLPLLGLLELGAYLWFGSGGPTLDDWRGLRERLDSLQTRGDLVVVLPRYLDPIARQRLGEGLVPLEFLARPDNSGVKRALLVTAGTNESGEFDRWRPLRKEAVGPFTVEVRENPRYQEVLFSLVEVIEAGQAEVFLWEAGREHRCRFRKNLPRRTGGLHGHVAFPSRRFSCPGSSHQFVGVTLIDDQEYRPRRCVWAHPPPTGELRIVVREVPPGRLVGHAGLSYFLMRDGEGTPVRLSVRYRGRSVGRYEHRDELGWNSFEFALPTTSEDGDLEFRISSRSSHTRHFCFEARVQ